MKSINPDDVTDFLPELSRLNLECNSHMHNVV